MPSINANNTPPTTAAEAIALGPARAARIPPVTPPEMMEFHGSSYKCAMIRIIYHMNMSMNSFLRSTIIQVYMPEKNCRLTFCRIAVKLQSQQANNPPQTANCPPMTGARAAQFPTAPISRVPLGDCHAPFPKCHMPPPMAPNANAPPISSMMR